VFHISFWRGLELGLVGISPPKHPRGDELSETLSMCEIVRFSLRRKVKRVAQ